MIFFAENWIQCVSTVLILPYESEDVEDELAGDDPDDQDYEPSGNSTRRRNVIIYPSDSDEDSSLDEGEQASVDPDEQYMPLLDYKLLLVEALTRANQTFYTPTRNRGRPAAEEPKRKRKRRIYLPLPEIANDGLDHLPAYTQERQLCKMYGCSGKSYIKCVYACGVFLSRITGLNSL